MKTIGIIAPSGACDKEKILNAKEFFESQGYNVKLSRNIFDKTRYLAGDDKTKLEELKNFFEDSEIDMIMAGRGGYGAIRLVNDIDYDVIKSNPKIFCGFSDVTALLLMIYKKTGLVTYHGPMASSDFSDLENAGKFSWENFQNAISGNELCFEGNKIYRSGRVEGIIWGGNLATVVSLCGLDFIPNEDFIFFAEDLNEPVYKIDKMFQQLINIETFRKNCKGIILGDFLDCGDDIWLEEYFTELAERLEIPVVGGYKITHEKDKITLPIGRSAEICDARLRVFSGMWTRETLEKTC